MADPRLQRKIDETRAIAAENGLDLKAAPLLVTFEMPIWGAGIVAHEVRDLARLPGTAVAAVSSDPLPQLRHALASAPQLHAIAERGLVCGLTGGATIHVYPGSELEFEAFAVALLAGTAASGVPFCLAGNLSSGRQEVTFGVPPDPLPFGARELLRAVRDRRGAASFAGPQEDALVLDDMPADLEAVRAALAEEFPGRAVRVARLPSGRFRIVPETVPEKVDQAKAHVLAQEIAMSSDRFLETRGGTTFGFVTEPVARWHYGPETGARRLARGIFNAPDTVITHLGLHPFTGEGTLFFAYEGSETIWEAANKAISCIVVRDVLEYGRVLFAIRQGE